MAESSATFHEHRDSMSDETREMHRGIVSLMEELEAVDWYNQRVDAAGDEHLKEILAHNRDEEKEHAMMVLEWLRRRDPTLDGHMRTYLFTEGDILAAEEEEKGEEAPSVKDSLAIGSLKGGMK